MHDHPHNHTDHTPDILNPRRAMLAGLGGLAAGAFLASTANAGPLTPPPGPIAPTPGPEPRIPINSTNTPGNVSPNLFRITAPGSYYLTGNIVGQAGRNGISIESSGVTLDLMGFNMQGVPGSLDGIRTTTVGFAALWRIVIRNGSVSDWGANGIKTSFRGGSIEAMHVSNNGAWGIHDEFGNSVRISGCTALNNGFEVANGGGIRTRGYSLIHACHAQSNTGTGIQAEDSSTIMDCISYSNSGDGIFADRQCMAIRNNCIINGRAGIQLTTLSRAEDNMCAFNVVGIRAVSDRNFIARNTCATNSTNWIIAAGNRCLVVNSASAPAINGDAGGQSPGSTNPNANYTY